MTAVFRSIPIALAVLLLTTGHSSAQVVMPPRDARPPQQPPPAVGTAALTGSVRMAGSTQPARKVRVSLSSPEIRGGRTAITDDDGRFSFTALPAGRYTLSANKPGHVSVTYGQRRPGRAGTPIQVSDGQKFQADLQIPRGSVITGTVFDEHGEPALQTSVRVMRVVNQNGRRTLQSSSSRSTDDRGIYRAFGLLPGDYIVCATPRNTSVVNFERVQVELQALQSSYQAAARLNAEQALAVEQRIASLQSSMPEDGENGSSGYSPVCYPGTVSAGLASPITLGVAEERPGVDIQLQLAPLARVEGTVANATGAQLRGINVSLSDAQQSGLSIGNISARTDAEGRFRLMNVPPGQYRLTARATIRPEQPAAGGRGAAPAAGRATAAQRPAAITVWAAADITVDGRNLANVLLSLQQGISLSGQVAFDGTSAPPADLTRIRVSASPVEPTGFGGSSSARVDRSGRFTIPSVPPGRYRLTAGGAANWTVESSSIGGQDAIDFPFEVEGNENIGGAVITFTDRQTELTGTVTDDKNQPAPEFTLVVFPADSRYWTASSRRIQNTRPGTDGRYTFRNLPPGDYRLAPVYDLEPGATSDPAFLQQLETTALRVSLLPGEKKTQDMRIGGM